MDNDIKQHLAYIMALMGVTEAQTPNAVMKQILVDFVKTNYKHYALAEIKTAFNMAAQKKLDCDCSYYGSFSSEYFGRIMSAYEELRRKAFLSLPKQPIETKRIEMNHSEKLKIQREFDESVVIPAYKKWLEYNVFDFGLTPPRFIYESLCEFHSILSLSNSEKIQIHQEATKSVLNQLEKLKETKSVTYQEHKNKLKKLSEVFIPENNQDEIKNECYLISIGKAFEKIKSEQIDLEKIMLEK